MKPALNWKIVLLLVLIAMSNLATHRKQNDPGCACKVAEDPLKAKILFQTSFGGFSVDPGETQSVTIHCGTEAAPDFPVEASWKLTHQPDPELVDPVSVPSGPEIAFNMPVHAREIDWSKPREFRVRRLYSIFCLEASPTDESITRGTSCLGFHINQPRLYAEPVDKTVAAFTLPSDDWSFHFEGEKKKLSYWKLKVVKSGREITLSGELEPGKTIPAGDVKEIQGKCYIWHALDVWAERGKTKTRPSLVILEIDAPCPSGGL